MKYSIEQIEKIIMKLDWNFMLDMEAPTSKALDKKHKRWIVEQIKKEVEEE